MSERLIDLAPGVVLVATDLHGAWEPYVRIRDTFLRLRERGDARTLVLCGDLIHAESDTGPDRSLDMLLDVMRLRGELGPDAVVMLLGNHEVPHIYSISLARGDAVFTPPFEAMLASLGEQRQEVIGFLAGLPLYARTAAGVLLTHAGAAQDIALPAAFAQLLSIDHLAMLAAVEEQLQSFGYDEARASYERITGGSYDREARELLAVTGPNDPRYNDLLRGTLATTNNYLFDLLWAALFGRNEQENGAKMYDAVVDRFLKSVSAISPHPQRVLVSGHMVTRGGYALVGEKQLRLSSYSHARPREAGLYLLLDTERPVRAAADLIPGLRPVFPPEN